MLTFTHLWIFALLPLPWLLRALLPARKVSAVAVRVPFGKRLRSAVGGGSSQAPVTGSIGGRLLPALIWLLLVTAIARPQWLEPPVTKDLPTRDLLLLVDLSGSMRQQDFTSAAGAMVDRLSAVKEVLGDFLTKREGDPGRPGGLWRCALSAGALFDRSGPLPPVA